MITHTEAQQVARMYATAMIEHDQPLVQKANRILNAYLDGLPPVVRKSVRYDFSGIVCAVCDELMREIRHE